LAVSEVNAVQAFALCALYPRKRLCQHSLPILLLQIAYSFPLALGEPSLGAAVPEELFAHENSIPKHENLPQVFNDR